MIFQISILKVPDYMLELIKEELQTKIQTIGSISSTEAKRKPFIDTFVNSCINMFQGEIDMEGYVQGRILKAFSAKKDIEYQSNYGQIISELYNSHLYNKSIGLRTFMEFLQQVKMVEQHFMPVQNYYENRIIANRNEPCLLNHWVIVMMNGYTKQTICKNFIW